MRISGANKYLSMNSTLLGRPFLFASVAAAALGGCSASDDGYQNPNRATPASTSTSAAIPGTGGTTSINPAPSATPTTPGTGNPAPTTTPTTPAPVTTPAGGQLLTPNATGWVDGAGNTIGIQGPWYSYNDCKDSPADCTLNQTPPEGDFANVGGKMCTKGSTAPVKAATEFSTKWGAGIALDLNNAGGVGAVKMPYNATSKGVLGFSFTLTGTAPDMRVNLPTPATSTASHFVPGSTGMVLFSQAMQGSWVTTRTALDASQVMSIQFQIPSKMTAPVAFDFCIENLKAITQ